MSYEPKEWKGGDAVTPSSLNHIENGISDLNGTLSTKANQSDVKAINDALNNFQFNVKKPNSTSFNNITTQGTYTVFTNVDAPHENSSVYAVTVICESGSISQTATGMGLNNNTLGKTYTRVNSNGVWSAWEQLALNSSLVSKEYEGTKVAITSGDDTITTRSEYSYYIQRNGFCYFQIILKCSDTSQHYLKYYLPKSAFGNYLYFYSSASGNSGELRVSEDGGTRIQLASINTWYNFIGSYPITKPT